MKSSELIRALEDKQVLEHTNKYGDKNKISYAWTSHYLGDIWMFPERFEIIKSKKKVRFCAFEEDDGELMFAQENSEIYDTFIKGGKYKALPEFNIEKEVEE